MEGKSHVAGEMSSESTSMQAFSGLARYKLAKLLSGSCQYSLLNPAEAVGEEHEPSGWKNKPKNRPRLFSKASSSSALLVPQG